MSRKTLQCKLHHAWGTKVRVCGETLTIDAETGTIQVTDEQAEKMLQNANKWDDPSKVKAKPKPTKAQSAASKAILADKNTGETLSAEETKKAMQEATGEDAEDEWPEVNEDMDREDLLAVLKRLKSAGQKVPRISKKMSNGELVDVIADLYAGM